MIMHGGLTRIREKAQTGGSGDTTSQLLACPMIPRLGGYFGRLPAVSVDINLRWHRGNWVSMVVGILGSKAYFSNCDFRERVQSFFFHAHNKMAMAMTNLRRKFNLILPDEDSPQTQEAQIG